TLASLFFCFGLLSPCLADTANGWRGNGTGLWPEAQVPTVWYRLPESVVGQLRMARSREGPPVPVVRWAPRLQKGLIIPWLVIGPFPVTDSVREFNEAQLADEATIQPAPGAKFGSLAWKELVAQHDDRWKFGTVALPVVDLAAAVGGFK